MKNWKIELKSSFSCAKVDCVDGNLFYTATKGAQATYNIPNDCFKYLLENNCITLSEEINTSNNTRSDIYIISENYKLLLGNNINNILKANNALTYTPKNIFIKKGKGDNKTKEQILKCSSMKKYNNLINVCDYKMYDFEWFDILYRSTIQPGYITIGVDVEEKKVYFEYFSNLNLNNKKNHIENNLNDNIGSNLIFYGAPGTGKSYGIQKYIQDDLEFKEIDVKSSDNVFRTTFHPEYGYSDFVGQIMPTVNEKGQLEYIFNPGSFTQALVYAYIHPDEPVFLILEEMSRANCASVFGDIFQLLDRDEQGESEYPINHLQLSNYLHKKLGESHSWNKYQSKIYIPRNLYLIGTMNTSDQNVFVMDTAFKRRFLMKYVPTTIDSSKNQFSLPYSDTETMEWNDFVKTVNDYIVDDKGLQLSEDKQLGQFFMKNYDAKDAMTIDPLLEESKVLYTIKDSKNFETYKDKVLYYLYHDVEKASYHTEKRLFNENIKSFGDLYQKATAKNHYDIYSKEFKECLEENIHPKKDVSYNMDDEIEENE